MQRDALAGFSQGNKEAVTQLIGFLQWKLAVVQLMRCEKSLARRRFRPGREASVSVGCCKHDRAFFFLSFLAKRRETDCVGEEWGLRGRGWCWCWEGAGARVSFWKGAAASRSNPQTCALLLTCTLERRSAEPSGRGTERRCFTSTSTSHALCQQALTPSPGTFRSLSRRH